MIMNNSNCDIVALWRSHSERERHPSPPRLVPRNKLRTTTVGPGLSTGGTLSSYIHRRLCIYLSLANIIHATNNKTADEDHLQYSGDHAAALEYIAVHSIVLQCTVYIHITLHALIIIILFHCHQIEEVPYLNTTAHSLSRVASWRTAIPGAIPILPSSVVYEPVIPCQPALEDW